MQQSTTILGCQRNGEDFVLSLAEGRSIASIETLILTAPPLQSAALIQEIEPTLGEELRETCRMSPAWVVLFKIADQFSRENYVFVPSEIITKVRHEHTKPGRKNSSQGSWFVAECSSEWSVENLERSPEWVSTAVLEALRADLGENFPVESSLAHRWRYASTQDPIGSKYLHNDNRSVWITGDWCLGKGIQSGSLGTGGQYDLLGSGYSRRHIQTGALTINSGGDGNTGCAVLTISKDGIAGAATNSSTSMVPGNDLVHTALTGAIGRLVDFDAEIAAAIDGGTLKGIQFMVAPCRHDQASVYGIDAATDTICLLYTSPSPRDRTRSRMPSSA